VQVWRKTLTEFKSNWLHQELKFKFKSGAWLVGSPYRNWEVAFLRDQADEVDVPYFGDAIAYNFNLLKQYYDPDCRRKIDIDFIGPSMDCGFRLLSLASEEKLILSADLAYLVAHQKTAWDHHFGDLDYPALDFYLDNPVFLKGVTSTDKEYPIVWLNAYQDTKLSPENSYKQRVRVMRSEDHVRISHDDVLSLLKHYLDELDGFPDLPYVCKPDGEGIDVVFRTIPSTHVDRINFHRSTYLNAARNDQSIIESFTQDESGDEKTDAEISDIASEVAQDLTS
jgi:hypothetical protein